MARMDRVKRRLMAEGLTCVVAGPAGEYTSTDRGIKPVLRWLEDCPRILKDASVADKVVGKAAALLFAEGGVREVWARLVSRPALEVFEAFEIPCTYQDKVERIKNRAGDGLCPMETRVMDVNDPAEAFRMFQELLN